jgi:hypothetical protein
MPRTVWLLVWVLVSNLVSIVLVLLVTRLTTGKFSFLILVLFIHTFKKIGGCVTIPRSLPLISRRVPSVLISPTPLISMSLTKLAR